ncbi:hypothetical protein [Streptomyces sp. FXJ1.172]|uniref:hypothetical protein n=1 Tax=Streptomyces sp. FXJ1.172 TaxID=710705 RepID=UPI003FA7662A
MAGRATRASSSSRSSPPRSWRWSGPTPARPRASSSWPRPTTPPTPTLAATKARWTRCSRHRPDSPTSTRRRRSSSTTSSSASASRRRPRPRPTIWTCNPSGSTTLCAAKTQAARRFLGDDVLNWTYKVAAGSLLTEPGHVPAKDIELHFATWSEFEKNCAMSRVWAGVHLPTTAERSLKSAGGSVTGPMSWCSAMPRARPGTAPDRMPAHRR